MKLLIVDFIIICSMIVVGSESTHSEICVVVWLSSIMFFLAAVMMYSTCSSKYQQAGTPMYVPCMVMWWWVRDLWICDEWMLGKGHMCENNKEIYIWTIVVSRIQKYFAQIQIQNFAPIISEKIMKKRHTAKYITKQSPQTTSRHGDFHKES